MMAAPANRDRGTSDISEGWFITPSGPSVVPEPPPRRRGFHFEIPRRFRGKPQVSEVAVKGIMGEFIYLGDVSPFVAPTWAIGTSIKFPSPPPPISKKLLVKARHRKVPKADDVEIALKEERETLRFDEIDEDRVTDDEMLDMMDSLDVMEHGEPVMRKTRADGERIMPAFDVNTMDASEVFASPVFESEMLPAPLRTKKGRKISRRARRSVSWVEKKGGPRVLEEVLSGAGAPGDHETMYQFGRAGRPHYICGDDAWIRIRKTERNASRFFFRIIGSVGSSVRLYAAAFDPETNDIFLGPKAGTFRNRDGFRDAIPTNGIRLWNPSKKKWASITVRGEARDPLDSRKILSHFPNILEDGAVIDGGPGIAFLYRTHPKKEDSMGMWAAMKAEDRLLGKVGDLSNLPLPIGLWEEEDEEDEQKEVMESTTMFDSFSVDMGSVGDELDDDSLAEFRRRSSACVVERHKGVFVHTACGHLARCRGGTGCSTCGLPGKAAPLRFQQHRAIRTTKQGAKTRLVVLHPCRHALPYAVAKWWVKLGCFYKRKGPLCPVCMMSLEAPSGEKNADPFVQIQF